MELSRRLLLVSGSAAALAATPVIAAALLPYRDARLPVSERVRDLLSRMTVEEKAAQLQSMWFAKSKLVDDKGQFSPEKARKALANGMGQIARPSDTAGTKRFASDSFRGEVEAVEFLNAMQRFAVEETRLGVPLLFHEEMAHGLAVRGATMFPNPTGLGSSWDPDLVERAFAHVGRQARLRGITVGLTPVVDLIRDPRWGRSEEFFGEDPYHVGEMGAAAVRGLQGARRPIAPDRVFAVLKHFVHGMPQNGLNVGPSDMSETVLRSVYLPSFRRAIRDGAASIMPSYNEVGGIPAHANRDLLQKKGRGLLKFTGPYISDYNGIGELATLHAMASTPADAALLAMRAGVDADLPEGSNYARLPELVRAGRLEEAELDAAAGRILALKFEAGLFERPYADADRAAKVLDDPAGPALARKLAERSLVLLKNDGTLPLSQKAALKIALIGPNSVEARRGGYAGEPRRAIGILEGLKAVAPAGVRIEQADGVWLNVAGAPTARPETYPIRTVSAEDNRRRIEEAVAVANRADLVILCVGETEAISREAVVAAMPGDRNDLGLYGEQDALVEAMLETGKPVVAVLVNGRPLAVNRLAERASALIEAWYPGEQGGYAVADALFGRVNPGGKLPVSFPRSVGELPAWYSRQPSADKVPYIEGKRGPLYPFGFGLSYTSFEVSEPRLPVARLAAGSTVRVEVDVANTGARTGDEVVQIYVRDKIGSTPRPVLELKAFRRVTLKAGERKTLAFDLGPESFAFPAEDLSWRIEEGEFTIFAGASSAALKKTTLQIDGSAAVDI